jgi:hypothetical protein
VNTPLSSDSAGPLGTAKAAVQQAINLALESTPEGLRLELAARIDPAVQAIERATDCAGLATRLTRIPALLGDPLAYAEFLGQLSINLAQGGREVRDRSSEPALSQIEATAWYECGEMIWHRAAELAEWCAREGDAI